MIEQFDVVVIGSGPGGYVAAIRASQLGFKTACIEKSPYLGGTCLNVGCIPSKTLLHSSELFWKLTHGAKELGIEAEKAHVNFSQMMAYKQKVVTGFNEGISALFKKNKVARFTGTASLLSSDTIEISQGPTKETLRAKSLILATGSEPMALPFLPFDERRILSSTGALSLSQAPKRFVVIGAGVIGVELGSVYSRLGSQVLFVEFLDKICPILDDSLSIGLRELLEAQGMHFYLSSKVTAAKLSEWEVSLRLETPQGPLELLADAVLVCIGRRPYTKGLGLENLGIQPNAKGFLPIDAQFRTTVPNIYAIGDLVDGPMLAHKASEEGIAVAEIIAGHTPLVHYPAIPSVVYTHPEVASVGFTEAELKSFGLSFKAGLFPFKANSRARCNQEESGFVKLLAESRTDRLLGVHILGSHASELINEAVLAIQKGLTAKDLAEAPHAHPTLGEALKEAALALHKRAIHK